MRRREGEGEGGRGGDDLMGAESECQSGGKALYGLLRCILELF